ncbi:hypothetical protein BGZ96_012261 [Linnemannia gamsii]|uniref:Protein kinase domain-containing protein n=1 Tax=Linnemannia gamsii TaxID=64522 RepID=A0ABQ7JRA7_9FUNG|nr:hypothetical protein BGZ96_012261 [Linnemannia gamsii]
MDSRHSLAEQLPDAAHPATSTAHTTSDTTTQINNNNNNATVTLPPPVTFDDGYLPLDGSTTTTLSFESGLHPALTTTEIASANADIADQLDKQLANQQSTVLTETLSSFTSNRSSIYNGTSSSTNNNLLSTFSSTTSSASRRSSMQLSKVEVRETLDASLTENADGFHQLKQYILIKEIGKGAFGKVHLAQDENTNIRYAVKEFSKSKLRKKDKANLFKLGPRGRGRGRRGPEAPSPLTSESSPLDLIRGEVAILKKLHHPNIVKLYEVLDVSAEDSMYMVFEYCEKGVLMPVSLTEKYENVFSDAECRDVFQQMILGIEYLHEHDIIHRDIKPDNLLRSGDGTVKIVDFGVSEMFNKKGDDLTKKSAGSPAFMAPELCRHDHGEVSGRATDVWSMGVTLYCIRYGTLPYVSESILEMHRVIREEDYQIPNEETEDPRFVALIHKLLDKDPAKRITIEQLRTDPWVTNNEREPLISKDENTANAVTEVTEEDLRSAVQKISSLATVIKAIARLKRGIKSPASRPISATAVLQSFESKISDRMQDADENTTPTAAPIVTPSTASATTTTTTTTGTTGATDGKASLEGPMNDVSLQVGTSLADSQQTSEKVEDKAVEEKVADEEPQGYQVCDFETGTCYWVPANKSSVATATSTPVPEAADSATPAEIAKVKTIKEDTKIESSEKPVKEEEKEKGVTLAPPVEITTTAPIEDKGIETSTTTTTATNTTKNKKDEAEKEAEQDGYEVCDPITGMCYWAPAKKAKVDPEQSTEASPIVEETKKEEVTKDVVPVVAIAVPSSPASKLDARQVTEETGSGTMTPVSESGSPNGRSPSPSPGSLNPGPRLVGKLSRDRLAMFENS